MSDKIYLGWLDIVRNRVRIRAKLQQKITTTAEPFFMQILRDLFNLKDQIKKE